LTKYDTLTDGEQIIEGDEDVVFMFLVFTIHVELADTFYGELFSLEFDLVGVWSDFSGVGADVVRESGGKEDDLCIP